MVAPLRGHRFNSIFVLYRSVCGVCGSALGAHGLSLDAAMHTIPTRSYGLGCGATTTAFHFFPSINLPPALDGGCGLTPRRVGGPSPRRLA